MKRDGKSASWVIVLILGLFLSISFTPTAQAINFEKIFDQVSSTLNTVDSVLSGKTFPETQQAAQGNALFGGIFGKWEDSWEKSAGQNGHETLKTKPGFSKDAKMLSRLGTVARKLVPTVERQDLKYTFAVLESDELNAFALPGGYVYVTKGLMKAIESDDELAGVVAHELGHVNKKHGIKQAEKAGLMTLLVAAIGLKDDAKKYQAAAAVVAFFANQKFSRNDEFEADKCAVNYTMKAGYNPMGLVKFFDKINNDTKLSKITKYFSTHPPTTERIDKVKAEIKKKGGNVNSTVISSTAGTTSGSSSSSASSSNPYSNVPGVGNTSGSSSTTTTTTQRYTNADLKAAYESYVFYKTQYEYVVSQGAKVDQVMKAFNAYQTAKERYFKIKAAMNQ
jgi:Zn-dependent protease with chaperone function